jgi:ABC-type multidrug transport system ATPase subunit
MTDSMAVPANSPLSLTPLLLAHAVSLSIDGQRLFSGLNFCVRPGLTLLQGGEGRGKSSLLAMMAGERLPDAGQLQRAAPTLYFQRPESSRHDATVARDWLQAQCAAHAGWQAPVAEALVEAFGLAEHLDKPMVMLSTGSRRKVGLVAAAASGAALTLLDQPYAALDGRSSRVLSELLREAAEGRICAWVIADHALPPGLAGAALAGLIDLGE